MAATPKRRVVRLADWVEAQRTEAAIDIVTDTETFTIDPPHLWPDAALARALVGDTLGVARALLGDRYEAFVAAGGSAAMLDKIIGEQHGATPGE